MLAAQSNQAANAFVIRASKYKWGKLQFAQAAITAHFQTVLPKHVNELQLTDKVNDILLRDPDYRSAYGDLKLARMTVRRALQKLREANR